MKTLILITLIIFTTLTGKAQSKSIDGFLGIKFGSTPGEVIKALKAKDAVEDVEYNNKYGRTGILRFKNVSLGSRICTDFMVSFANDKACQAEFIFDTGAESKCVDYYIGLRDDLIGVYGAEEIVPNPMRYNDDAVTAIKNGKADFEAYWHDGNNLIWAHITLGKYSEILVSLVYRSSYLFNLYQNQQNERNKSEL